MDFSEMTLTAYQLVPFTFLMIVLIVMGNVMLRVVGRSTKKTIRTFKK